jgi:hemin uptake protein HemP
MKPPDSPEKSVSRQGLVLSRDDLPMTIEYKNKKYTLILTKNDKLILNKAVE